MPVSSPKRKQVIRPSSEAELTVEQEIWGTVAAQLDEVIADREAAGGAGSVYAQYPSAVEFGEQQLREHYTPDIEELMRECLKVRAMVAQSANATGKTHAGARIAIHAFLKNATSQIFVTAPGKTNLEGLLWAQISAVVVQNKRLFPPNRFKVSLPSMRIERRDNPQSFIQGLTIPKEGTPKEREAKFSGKHAPFLMFLVDEADAVPPEVFDGIESCMSGGETHLVGFFNPRRQAGPIFQMQRSRRIKTLILSALRHPNVISGDNIIPGAVDRETTVRRINMWTRPLQPQETVDHTCFLIPEYLIGTTAVSHEGVPYPALPAGYRKIIDPSFSYMVLGEYPTSIENTLIPADKIDAAVERWKEYGRLHGEIPYPGMRPRVGLDVADLGNDQNVFTARYDDWVAPQLKWQGVDPYYTGQTTRDLYLKYNGYAIFVDSTGVGAGVPGHLEGMGLHGVHRVMAQSSATKSVKEGEFERLRDQGWWEMADWFKYCPTAMIPDESSVTRERPGLVEQLKAATYEIREVTGKIKVMSTDKFRELHKASPDEATSLMLTFCPLTKDASSAAFGGGRWA